MTTATATPVRQVDMNDIDQLLQRAKQTPLNDEECEMLRNLALSYFKLGELLESKDATIGKLRKALFGASSEKTKKLKRKGDKDAGKKDPAASSQGEVSDEPKTTTDGDQEANDDPKDDPPNEPSEPSKGHGRNGVEGYKGATRTEVPHGLLKSGDACPTPNCNGRVYRMAEPSYLVRITGHPPIQAQVYGLERLRCNLCLVICTAKAPEGVGEQKYDASAASIIGLLRYGSGVPFYRLAGLQLSLGVPLPTSTQWDIVADCAPKLVPVYTELVRQAAQGELLHNDDTAMTILELQKKHEEKPDGAGKDESGDGEQRTGVFTTGIVAIVEGRKIVIFFTGPQHAGENLADVLSQRVKNLSPPMQMCDALSRNKPGEFEVILGNCILHARRKFVDVIDRFPDECLHVIDELREVYRNDAKAKELGLSPEERLSFHQAQSGPVTEKLKAWLEAQIDERRAEPNSGLGKAIRYFLKHWSKMTLFLRVAGAPLDNNSCERALKRAILHRKNSLFYKTQNGAKVGDLFMSLIHTAEQCGENPFEYLTKLLEHANAVRENPPAWVPWKFRETTASHSAT